MLRKRVRNVLHVSSTCPREHAEDKRIQNHSSWLTLLVTFLDHPAVKTLLMLRTGSRFQTCGEFAQALHVLDLEHWW